jgi:hypothetical protein
VDNQPSQHVAAKAGFSREGVLRSYLLHRGVRADYRLYSRLPSDAEPSAASSADRPGPQAQTSASPRPTEKEPE